MHIQPPGLSEQGCGAERTPSAPRLSPTRRERQVPRSEGARAGDRDWGRDSWWTHQPDRTSEHPQGQGADQGKIWRRQGRAPPTAKENKRETKGPVQLLWRPEQRGL